MRKTVVRSFTTPFMMHSLFLRGMHVSPNGRYLVFMADDQTNWDINVDGLAVTRVHFHQFDDWSVADTQMSLTRIINKEYEGELRYNLWELLNEATVMGVVDLVQHLLQMDIPAESDKQQQRRLFILNFINSTYKDDQISALLAGARNDALDFHVKSLFAYIHNLTSAEYTLLPDDDKAYLAQVNWAVSQPVYSTIAGDLPKIGGGSAEMKPLSCPICQKEMRLHSRQVALCASNHIFDTCSVTLDILKTPGSDQCNTCNAKCRRVSSRHSASLISRLKSAFPLCPFCEGHFYSVF
ncbi:hypothetical protein GQ54DRAFT_121647 [Martensiomyces pterosporus]|nr:hypothetical protein GQ54DRAFT_121647 [Martensiomyces pterosporus]